MNAPDRALRAMPLMLLALGLSGCLSRPVPLRTGRHAALMSHVAHAGRPYRLVPGQSRLIILVYRAGPLAALGHNHVIACRCLSGTVYVPRDVLSTRFALRIAVAGLTVDDPNMRAAQRSAAFPPEVSDAARRGTRHNMLGPAVLNAHTWPVIAIRAAGLRRAPAGRSDTVLVRARIRLRGRLHSITVPVHYSLDRDRLQARGTFRLNQTSLGLTPFSVLFGALRVKNQLTVRFHLLARRSTH